MNGYIEIKYFINGNEYVQKCGMKVDVISQEVVDSSLTEGVDYITTGMVAGEASTFESIYNGVGYGVNLEKVDFFTIKFVEVY